MMNSCCYLSHSALHSELQAALNRTRTAEQYEQQARTELQIQQSRNDSNMELIVQLRDRLTAEAARNQKLEAALSVQQFLLAQWVLSQRAFTETAMQLGAASHKTMADLAALYKDNVAAVLANTTRHGNDATSHPLLEQYAEKLRALPQAGVST